MPQVAYTHSPYLSVLSSELFSACAEMGEKCDEAALTGAHHPLWLIAYSGGLDSHVMLHSMLSVCRSNEFKQRLVDNNLILPRIEAVHIDHGLQASSKLWAEHCLQVCNSLSIKLHIAKANLNSASNIEAEARKARFRLISEIIKREACPKNAPAQSSANARVFLAQHQQDQVETFLYRLVRGTGLRGLLGMPKQALLADVDVSLLSAAYINRPLLNITQQQLQDYAKAHALEWVEDPSNENTQFDRNFLRSNIIPLLQSRWPKFQARLAKNIEFLQQSQAMLNELAKLDIQQSSVFELAQYTVKKSPLISPFVIAEPCFHYAYYQSAPEGQSRFVNALQYWLREQSKTKAILLQLSQSQLEQLSELVCSEDETNKGVVFEIAGSSYAIHRFKRGLYLVNQVVLPKPEYGQWLSGEVVQCLGRQYVLNSDGSAPVLTVKGRPESAVMLMNGKHKKIKKLLQEVGVPSWARDGLPYVYAQDELVAVANVLRSDTLISHNLKITEI